jgi:hypothetical protein
MGVFFTVPLYLQLVLGLDALETGIKMLPVSITMFIASAVGLAHVEPLPGARRRPRRPGDTLLVDPRPARDDRADPRRERRSRCRWRCLGIGMGLLASQLGNVVQSSVDASGRGRPAACSSPVSSWGRRSVSRSSVPSCSADSRAPSSPTSSRTHGSARRPPPR